MSSLTHHVKVDEDPAALTVLLSSRRCPNLLSPNKTGYQDCKNKCNEIPRNMGICNASSQGEGERAKVDNNKQ